MQALNTEVQTAQKTAIYLEEADRDQPWHQGWSDAVVSAGMVFVSGVIAGLQARETDTDMEQALVRAFERITRILQKAGADWHHVVSVCAYLTDVDTQVPLLDKVRLGFVQPPYPASTVVQVTRLIPPRGFAEICVTARLAA